MCVFNRTLFCLKCLVLFLYTRLDRGFSIGAIIKPQLAFNRYISLIHPQVSRKQRFSSQESIAQTLSIFFCIPQDYTRPISTLDGGKHSYVSLSTIDGIAPTPYLNLSAQANLPSGAFYNNKRRPGSSSHGRS
jgi:hypothetical protein